ncbi:right-handed parallel beta-helix repeat-containing protein [Beggiatoa leptomitoformis]|nr:right-handed parallel beta-helix repeat-containing protein [Beggiatoa leptomitoformis]
MQLIKIFLLFLLLGFYTEMVTAESFLKTYHLPPLSRVPSTDSLQKQLNNSKVLQRAEAVSIPLTMIETHTIYEQRLRQSLTENVPQWAVDVPVIVFSDAESSRLNAVLAQLQGSHKIILTAQTIVMDEPLRLPSDTWLVGNQTVFLAMNNDITDTVIINAAKNVQLSNINIKTQGTGVRIVNSQLIILNNLSFTAPARGVVIQDSAMIELAQLIVTHPQQGGIVLQGDTHHVWLHNSQISDGQNPDNNGAGVLLTDMQVLPTTINFPTNGLAQAIFPLMPAPHALLIEENRITGHFAQGIYSDGGYGNLILRNYIADNDKEGLCLDFGSVNNVIQENTFIHNGFRSHQTDESLKQDLVFKFGKLADGSSVAKLPAISLDNAAQNLLIWNTVRDGAGDGIKLVRSGLRNLILFNTLMNNNQGENSRFHFFGILLGNAGLEPELTHNTPDEQSLDFLPAIENIVAANVIYNNHYSGILLDKDSAFNDIYDNMVRHYQNMPLESASSRFNSIVGNSWQITEEKSGWFDWFH